MAAPSFHGGRSGVAGNSEIKLTDQGASPEHQADTHWVIVPFRQLSSAERANWADQIR